MTQSAFGVILAWDPSPDTNVTGYAVQCGTNSGSYQTRVDVGNQTNATILPPNGATYFFVAIAYTVDGVESLPSNEVSYSPSATPTNQAITFGALAAKTFGAAAFQLNATASSGLPVSFSSGNPSVATIASNAVTIVGAGTAVITASQAGNSNYTAAANVTQTLTVNKATATMTLSGLSATYSGTAKSATATTTPSSLPVTITYNGSATAPVNAGSYAVVATINHANYTGSASGTLTIAQPSQTITFGALASKTFGVAAFPLSATASSGLPVSFSSGNPSVATIAGNTVTIVGAGSAALTAAQAGNSNYTAAANVTQTLTVNKATATVTLSGLSATYNSTAKSATATTTPSSLPVTITYNGSATAPVNAGSYAVVATINHANYTGSASGTLTIAQPSQTITFGALAAKTFGVAAFPLSATASSGLPVSFSSGNPSVATIAGNTVTIVGAGSAVLTAAQAGNSNYTAAANVTQTLTVNKATATVTLSGLSATYDGTTKAVTATTSPGSLPTTITYNGRISAPVNAGSYTVVATIRHPNYIGSASDTLTIVVSSNTAPVFAATTDYRLPVLSSLSITLHATDADIPTNTITYSFGPNAPATATLDAQSGEFSWTPPLDAGGSSNFITVLATDNGVPPLTTTQQFSITVPHFIQVTLGTPNLFAGQTGSVSVRVLSSAPWRALSFGLDIPPGALGRLGLSTVGSPFTATSLAPVDATHWQLSFTNELGHELQGTQQLASLTFTAVGVSSAFVPLAPQDFSPLLADGTPFSTTFADQGRVVVIADQPILEALTLVSNRHQLRFYGNPGVTYQVQTATNSTPPIVWLPFTSVVLSNIVQSLEGDTSNVPFRIYRAVKP